MINGLLMHCSSLNPHTLSHPWRFDMNSFTRHFSGTNEAYEGKHGINPEYTPLCLSDLFSDKKENHGKGPQAWIRRRLE